MQRSSSARSCSSEAAAPLEHELRSDVFLVPPLRWVSLSKLRLCEDKLRRDKITSLSFAIRCTLKRSGIPNGSHTSCYLRLWVGLSTTPKEQRLTSRRRQCSIKASPLQKRNVRSSCGQRQQVNLTWFSYRYWSFICHINGE